MNICWSDVFSLILKIVMQYILLLYCCVTDVSGVDYTNEVVADVVARSPWHIGM